jgi:putative ABC transport system substrate-binding protein
LIKRRDFVTALGTTLIAMPFGAPARSQSGRVIRIGLLLNSGLADELEAFVSELATLGYAEGRNLVLDKRLIETTARNTTLAAELVAAKPDLLIGAGTQQVEALKRVAGSTPIVFANTGDPVGRGLVASLARPGGNVTGISNMILETATKRLQLISEVKPDARRIAMLVNPLNPFNASVFRETQPAAAASGIDLIQATAGSPDELPGALQQAVDQGAGGLIGGADVMIVAQTPTIVAFAARQRLPTIFSTPRAVRQGGLMSYGAAASETWRSAARLVGKILIGAKPADLPVEQATRVELVINLKTAKALGLTIPPSIFARADEVIE